MDFGNGYQRNQDAAAQHELFGQGGGANHEFPQPEFPRQILQELYGNVAARIQEDGVSFFGNFVP